MGALPTPLALPLGYPVYCTNGVLAQVGAVVRDTAPAHRVAIISDRVVGAHHASAILAQCAGVPVQLFTIPPGEQEKTRARWAELTDALVAWGAGRDTTIIALGGGVVGDLLIVGNTALYSFYLVLSRPLLQRHPPLSVVAGVFAWGVPLTLPFTGLPPVEAPAVAWAAMAWILAGPTVGTYLLNLVALQHVPATVVGVFIALQPFVAAALAVPLLGETLGWRQVVAASASVGGILLVSRRPPPLPPR